MPKLALLTALVASLASAGCLSQNGASPTLDADGGTYDAGPPVTYDASSPLDGASLASLTTGLGSGAVAHSAHFTIITKTGQEPGGAGFKSSANFKIVSGAAPAASSH